MPIIIEIDKLLFFQIQILVLLLYLQSEMPDTTYDIYTNSLPIKVKPIQVIQNDIYIKADLSNVQFYFIYDVYNFEIEVL